MVRRFLGGVVLALLLGITAAPTTAQNPDFWVANNTGRTINQVYVSASTNTNWGADRLGQNVLNSGQRIAIRPARDGNCVFDIRVVYADGGAEERRRVNVCTINEVMFTAAGAATPGQQSGPNPDFRLVNRSGRTISQLFVSRSQQTSWGADRLGTNVLPAGRSVVVTLPRDGNCLFDIRVVYDNDTATERRRVNTCSVTEITFP